MSPSDLPPLPEPFVRRLGQLIPADLLPAVLASFASHKPVSFRVNPLRGPAEATIAELAGLGLTPTPITWYPEAFLVETTARSLLSRSAAADQGRLYIQGLASMAAPLALSPRPGETVLDLAAAPGGKTLQLATLMANQGRLSAVEPVKDRFFKLRANLKRLGVTIARCYQTDGRSVGHKCPEMFDRVLLDAPCSSEARFSRLAPESWAHWSPRKIKETARKQNGLLQAALISLKPGGTMLYCTCALSPEENEVVVDNQLRLFAGTVAVAPLALPFPNILPGLTNWDGKELAPELAGSVRILPDALMDAFYLCKLIKKESILR